MHTRKSTVAAIAAALGLAGALVAVTVPSGAPAQSLVSTGGSFLTAELLPGRMVGKERVVGLRFTMASGWKTYWRAPGEAGVPPSFDWKGSENLADAEVLWPRPEVFESFGMTSIGYGGSVVLPVRLVPEDAGRPISVSLDLTLGVCREICVFEETTLSAELPPSYGGDGRAIAAALATVPRGGAEAGVEALTCTITGAGADGEDGRFAAELLLSRGVMAPHLVIEGPGEVWFHGLEVATEARDGGGSRLEITADVAVPKGAWIGRDDIRLTVLDGDYAADIRGCTAPAG